MQTQPEENRSATAIVLGVVLLALLTATLLVRSPREAVEPIAPQVVQPVEPAPRTIIKTAPPPEVKRAPEPKKQGLQTLVSIELVGLTFEPTILHLAKLGGFQVVIDRRMYRKHNVLPDDEIGEAEFRDAPIRHVLDHILHYKNLNWYRADGVIKIITANEAHRRHESRVYAIESLLDPKVPVFRPSNDAGSLSNVRKVPGFSLNNPAFYGGDGPPNYDITSAIKSAVNATWVEDDPEFGGSIDELNELLAIRQPREVQELIADLIRGLNLAAAGRLVGGAYHVETSNAARRSNAAARAALETSISIDYKDAELKTILKDISQKTGRSIVGYPSGFFEYAPNLNVKATLSLKAVQARSALNFALEQHNLSYHLDNGVVVVMKADAESHRQFAVIYDIRDLIATGNTPSSVETAIRNQTRAIWYENDPESGGNMSPVVSVGVIVVRQTESVHRQIGKLLADMRTQMDRSPTKKALVAQSRTLPAAAPAPEDVVTRYYPAITESRAKSLSKAIRRFVAPDSWTVAANKAAIEIVEGTLVIRHKVKYQRQIQQFVDELNAAETRQMYRDQDPNPPRGSIDGPLPDGSFFGSP